MPTTTDYFEYQLPGVNQRQTSRYERAKLSNTAVAVAVTFTNAASTGIASGTTRLANLAGTVNTPSAGSLSPVITFVTGQTNFSPGSRIGGGSGSGIPAGAYIVSMSGTTATMNLNSGGTSSGVAIYTPDYSVPWRYQRTDLQPIFRFNAAGTVAPLSPYDGTQTPPRKADGKFPYHIEFDFDGQAFEIIADQQVACTIRVWANELVSADSTLSATGATGFHKVDFGSVAFRRVTIETDGNLQLVGIRTAITNTITPPTSSVTPPLRAAILGDSYAVGTGTVATLTSHQDYGSVLLRSLGIVDSRHYATTGVGVVAANSGTGNYRTKISDVTGYAPDVLFIQGSINDIGQTGIQAELTTLINAVRAAVPGCTVIMIGIIPTHTPIASEIAVNTAYAAACTATVTPYIDAVTSPWIFGTGNAGATTGDGNADVYQSALSANHPTLAGDQYIGRRIAAAVASILNISL